VDLRKEERQNFIRKKSFNREYFLEKMLILCQEKVTVGHVEK